jgi:hypothetical protein
LHRQEPVSAPSVTQGIERHVHTNHRTGTFCQAGTAVPRACRNVEDAPTAKLIHSPQIPGLVLRLKAIIKVPWGDPLDSPFSLAKHFGAIHIARH